MKKIILLLLAINNLWALPILSETAEVKLDTIVTLYPDHIKKDLFYFNPTDNKISKDSNNRYRLSLGYWDLNNSDRSDGGAFFHIVMNNKLSPDQQEVLNNFKANRAKKKLKTIYAPLPIEASWIQPDDLKEMYVETHVPKHGSTIEGNVSLSATLTERGALMMKRTLLSEVAPGQVSYCFKSKGLTHRFDASIKADWNLVYKHFKAKLGAKLWIFRVDLEHETEKLVKRGDITIETNGGNDKDRAYIQNISDTIQKNFFKLADPKLKFPKNSAKGYKLNIQNYKSETDFKFNYKLTQRENMHLNLCNPLSFSGATGLDEYIFDLYEEL